MEVEAEIRVQVDELMRQELKNLKLVSHVTWDKEGNSQTNKMASVELLY